MNWIAEFLHTLDKGRWFIGFFQFFLSFIMLLKLFDAPLWLYIVASVLAIPVVWLPGYILIKTGLWDGFTRASNIGIKEWFNTKKD